MKWILVAAFLHGPGVDYEMRLPVEGPFECALAVVSWIESATALGHTLVSYSCTMMEAQ